MEATFVGRPRRPSAVVFIHPTEPPTPELPGLPVLDYPFDTTRTAVHMTVNGLMSRYANLKVILSHAGGFLPYAATRFTAAAQFNPGTAPDGILTNLKRFYFDTALSSNPFAIPYLLAFADSTHILYGTGYPFAPKHRGAARRLAGQLPEMGKRPARCRQWR